MNVRCFGRLAAAALVLGTLPVAGCTFGSFGAFDDLTRSEVVRPRPQDCGECHVEIYEEWSASAHARSYSGALYDGLTASGDFRGCVTCHAPDSVYDDLGVRARDVRPHDGVDCVSCHLDQGALVGPMPTSALVQPHPVVTDSALHRTSELCGRCHEGTYRQWEGAAATEPDGREKRTCQACHMPPVERKITQATNALSTVLVAAEDAHLQRRHRFEVGALAGFEGAAEIRLRPGAAGLLVEVENRLPHALPTGDFGPRRVELRLRFLDASGSDVGGSRITMLPRQQTAILAFGTIRHDVVVPEGAVRVTALLLRPGRRDEGDLPLATAEEDLR